MRKILFISCFLILTSCFYDNEDNKWLKINNQSDSSIFSIISSDDNIGTLNYYNGFPSHDNNYVYDFPEIASKSISNANDRPRFWNELFKKSNENKVRVFIVEKEIVIKYGWEYIISKNIYSYKFKVSEQELDKIEWQLTYK